MKNNFLKRDIFVTLNGEENGMKAYLQGHIDYFCGVYAVINSCRRVLRKDKIFSYNDGCLFYQNLMGFLMEEGKLDEVLHHGTDFDLIMNMAEQGQRYVEETFGTKISFTRPYTETHLPPADVFDELAALSNEKTSCIIRLSNKDVGDHWSVVSGKTAHGKIKLFDSYGYDSFDLKTTLWLPDGIAAKQTPANPTGMPKPPKGKTYVAKQGLIFVKAF